MKITILTQDDPFYLPDAIDYFLSTLPKNFEVQCIVLLPQTVSGQKQNFFLKMFNTFRIFGYRFFLKYSIIYIIQKIFFRNTIYKISEKHNLPLYEACDSINNQENVKYIKKFTPDILVSIGASQIFKKEIFNLAPYGCLNLHTGLLPKYRGLMPTFWAMLNGENKIGISVFEVDEGIDSGPILIQKTIRINAETHSEIIKKTKKIGMDSIIEAINLKSCGGYTSLKNDLSKATYFGFPTRKDVKIFLKSGKKF
jgi:methionyl-tRNA formyltransferase